MAHDPRIVHDEASIESLARQMPEWVKTLERPATPALIPTFGSLAGLRVVGTGVLIAQPFIGTKLAEFGAEVILVVRTGGDTFPWMARQLTRGPGPHGWHLGHLD